MTRIVQINAEAPERDLIRDAAAVLRNGGLVAFPTETVYGLGGNALDPVAVERIFAAKGRPATDPVIVHIANVDQLDAIASHVPPVARELAAAFWPGALTLILEKRATVPDSVTAGLATVAVRMPSHPIARALIEQAAVPVAAPSANRFSRPSPTRAEHVLADLEGRIDVVIDGGPTPIGVESTIVDLTASPPLIRRPGGIAPDAIASVVPGVQVVSHVLTSAVAQPAPGQLLRHYAPRARVTLYVGPLDQVNERVATDIRNAVAGGTRIGVLAPADDLMALAPRLAAIGGGGRVVTMRCGTRDDREAAARDLFQSLRALDAENVDAIYAIAPTGDGINLALIDRLTRAAEGRVINLSR
jgi:L-threonylcarbamoyladenylate synthase